MIGPILLALAPVALLVACGHGLRRTGFIADAFWPQAERLCYYVLLPALFADGLANARLQSLPVLPLAAALVGSTALAAALLLLVRPFVQVDGAGFTSVFQGAVRFNNYVGTALAAGLFGAKGIALAAVCVAAIVPTVNLMCVLVFARYGSTRLGAAASCARSCRIRSSSRARSGSRCRPAASRSRRPSSRPCARSASRRCRSACCAWARH
ncbi:hypothetical protein CSX04_06898 [Burkholderia cepacia]|nr:hypothetical protein CSX04_06898 [Burkholderia cepacia]